MARIRSIKPEFWTSEQVADCSPTARLLFLGMLTFCDDDGNHPASLKTLKMEIFPADDFNSEIIKGFVVELGKNGLIVEYEADSKQYWHVTGWRRHQKIEKPTYKHPKFDDYSTITRQPFGDYSTITRIRVPDLSTTESSRVESKGVESVSQDTEFRIRECIEGRTDKIKELFPKINIPLETETIVTKYQGKTIGADPWPLILACLKSVKVPLLDPVDPTMTTTQDDRDRARRSREAMQRKIDELNADAGVNYGTA